MRNFSCSTIQWSSVLATLRRRATPQSHSGWISRTYSGCEFAKQLGTRNYVKDIRVFERQETLIEIKISAQPTT
jgi:hypothetical protein